MTQTAPKIARKIGHAALDVAAILLALVIVIHLSLGVAAVWLNTPSGQELLRRNIDLALAESGYTLHFKAISYDPLDGVVVRDFNMGDGAGPLVGVDQFSVRVGLLPFAARQGAVTIRAGHVTLYRLPAGNGTEKPTPAESSPFIIPDIFLTSIVLERLSIARLDVQDAVMGAALHLGVDIRAKMTLSPVLSVRLDGGITQRGENPLAWVPEKIALAAGFDGATSQAEMTTFAITAPSYQLKGAGRASFQPGGAIDISVDGAIDDLHGLAGEPGKVNVRAQISGPTADPVVAATGQAVMDRFVAAGLPVLDFKLDVTSLRSTPSGAVSFAGVYRDQPLSLSSGFAYAAPDLKLSDMVLTGPDAKASGGITLDTQSFLAQGAVHLDVKNLNTYAPLAGVDIGGAAVADVALSTGDDANQSVSVTLDVRGGRYETYRVESATLTTALADIKNPWPQKLDLALSNATINETIRIKRATADLKKRSGSDYRFTVDASGEIPQPVNVKGGVTLSGLAGGQPHQVSVNDIDLVGTIGGSALTMTGQTDLVTANIDIAGPKIALADLPVTVPDHFKDIILSGTASLRGALAKPDITMAVQSRSVKLADAAPVVGVALDASYRDGMARAVLKGSGQGIRTLSVSASVPMILALSPFAFDLPGAAPLAGDAVFDLDGGVLSRSVLPPDHKFSGALRGDVKISGTIAKPDVTGVLNLADGAYHYDPLNVALEQISIIAAASPTGVEIKTLSARDGEQGVLDGRGFIDFTDNTKTNAILNLANFHLLQSDRANGYASAAMKVTGKKEGYAIGGTIDLGEINVMIPEQFQTNIPQLNIVEPDAKTQDSTLLQMIDLAIAIHAPGHVFVRGWGLDAEFGGDLEMSGTLAAPLVNGSFESLRGRYEEFGKRFALDQAKLRFQGAIPPSPYLDIKATTIAGDVQASVLLTGPVAKPGIGFASVPALPEDEVVSRILFGKNMSGITPFQAVQLTQTLQRFSGKGGGGFDPLGALRSATGLDDIRVDSEEGGETSVGVGKYLTEKVYLEVEKGAGATSGAATIQIELTPSIKVDSKIGQDAQGGAGIFWSRDY